MIKEELIRTVAVESGYKITVVRKVIETMLSTITKAVSCGDKVYFSGFGSFESVERAARTGKNINTGEKICIPARIVPVFKAGCNLKRAVRKESL